MRHPQNHRNLGPNNGSIHARRQYRQTQNHYVCANLIYLYQVANPTSPR